MNICMQTIEFAKKSTSKTKQKTEQQVETVENKREGHGHNIALTKKVYRLTNSDTFYCESEKVKDQYYFIRYESSFEYCSCFDNSYRHIRCKHLYAVEYAIRKNTLQEIEHLPENTQRYPQKITSKSSFEEEEYSF